MLSPLLLLLTLAAPPAEPAGVLVEGTVTDAAGRPVEGAELFLAESTPVLGIAPAVRHRGRSGKAGEFQVRLPEEPEDRYRAPKLWTLWAYRAGSAAGWRAVPRDWPPRGQSLRLVLGAESRLEVRVRAPDGSPAAGVLVSPARVAGRVLPAALADGIASRTDKEGRATLTAFTPDEVELLRVGAPALGVQQFALPAPGGDGVRSLTLWAAGRVEGRVTAGDPRAVRGLTLHLSTRADPSDDPLTGGFAEATTDEAGRFMVPTLAEGALTVKFVPHLDLPFRGTFDAHPEVEAGRTTRVEVPLKKGVHVTGVVREQGTGKPLAGALVRLDWSPEVPRLHTDAEGKYEGWIAAGAVTPHVPAPPKGYYYPRYVLDTVPIPAGAAEVAARPYPLARGVAIRGRVHDADGKAVPGAAVQGRWLIPEGEYDTAEGWADRDGTFVLEGIDPKADVRLTAHAGEMVTDRPATVRPGAGDPITLTVRPGGCAAVAGRVRDTAGRPVAGIAVHLSSGLRSPRGQLPVFDRPVTADECPVPRTGADGRFRTPRCLPADLEYRVEIDAPGFLRARSEWLEVSPGRITRFPDLVLLASPPLRTVAGRVTDREGKPVAGAVVFQSGDGPHRTRTTTDDRGRFRLPGVYEGRAILFVERQGYAFEGHAALVAGRPVELTVDRGGAPLARPAPGLSRARERAVALELLQPLAPRALLGGLGNLTYQLADVGPRVAPALALEYAESGKLGELADTVRLAASEGLMDDALDEALAIAETVPEARWRTQAYIKASDRVRSADRSRKQQLLDTALLYARSDPSAVGKLDGLGQIAVRWLDLGERDRATRILREGQAYAATLPRPSASNRGNDATHARGRFAAKLARIDTKAALELAEGFEDPYHDWYVGGVALGLAGRDPAGAERLAGQLRYGTQRYARLCGRMAPADRARARALADRIDDPHDRAGALAGMARALVKSDPEAAAGLLDGALSAYETLAREGRAQVQYYQSTCVLAAFLLPVAEQLGPEHLRRSFWRAVALRPPRPARGDVEGSYETATAQLALLLARYDPAVARTVLGPAVLRLRDLPDPYRTWIADDVFAAAAAIDPAWAVSLLESLPDRAWPGGYRPRDHARVAIADVLAHGGTGRWEHVASRYAYLNPDSTDDER
jgi:protocatechuate 3,4-dioxygenase beta subunit